jgi:Uma2 family endonuclease
MAVDIGLNDVHRMSADDYHRLIDSGSLDEDMRVELIEGLVLDMSPKSPAHERVISFFARRLFTSIDLDRYEVRVGAPLSIGDSEPEPDLIVFGLDTDQPYHPATAALVIEVAVSSQRRDLRTKPAIYARAGVPVYWVIDVDAGSAVAHARPVDGAYGLVEIVPELSAAHVGLAPIAVADVLAAAG